jgi:CoA:oxalate CoA-transferase
MNKPLKGVRVLDLTQAYSGPFCTMNLADHGAEVIKIERPGMGDQTRNWGPIVNGESGYFAYINRNKKGITLDLKVEEGKRVFRDLIKNADVVVENYKVGVMEKLGFSYEEMKKINPGIIYGSISGFGLEGPLSDRPCYDIVAQAMSGMMSVTGFSDGAPCKIGPSVGDSFSGAYLCMGILMALYQKQVTGEGQRLDVAMVDTLFSTMENFVVEHTIEGKHPHRAGNMDPSIAPFDSFSGKDGDFVMGCGTDKMFAGLCKLMNKEDLITNPLYNSNVKRVENYHTGLKAIIEEWTKSKTVDELEELITEIKIPFGNILTIPEVVNHPQTAVRKMLLEVDQPKMGKIMMPGTPIKIHGKPDSIEKASPLLGEDNEAILADILGYGKEKIELLKASQVI